MPVEVLLAQHAHVSADLILQWDNSLSVSGERMNGGVRSIIRESSGYTLTDDEKTLICNWNIPYQNTHIKPQLITHRSELSQNFRTGIELFISESQTSKKLAAHYRAFVLGKLASGRESKWIKTTWRSSPFTPLSPFLSLYESLTRRQGPVQSNLVQCFCFLKSRSWAESINRLQLILI